jgi:hypothetical protein
MLNATRVECFEWGHPSSILKNNIVQINQRLQTNLTSITLSRLDKIFTLIFNLVGTTWRMLRAMEGSYAFGTTKNLMKTIAKSYDLKPQ